MFDLRAFVKEGLLKAIGIQSDYWVILTSANWLYKGVLVEDDLAEIQAEIDKKNTPSEVNEVVEVETPSEEETVENEAENEEIENIEE